MLERFIPEWRHIRAALEKGNGDWDFARIVYFLINPLTRAYYPETILVSCGFDLYAHERLGGMRVTPGGYAIITSLLKETVQMVCNGRIAFIMEGGYSLKGIRECALRVIQELCDVRTLRRDKIDKMKTNGVNRFSTLKKVIEIQKVVESPRSVFNEFPRKKPKK